MGGGGWEVTKGMPVEVYEVGRPLAQALWVVLEMGISGLILLMLAPLGLSEGGP